MNPSMINDKMEDTTKIVLLMLITCRGHVGVGDPKEISMVREVAN